MTPGPQLTAYLILKRFSLLAAYVPGYFTYVASTQYTYRYGVINEYLYDLKAASGYHDPGSVEFEAVGMEIILPDGTVETYKFDKDYVDEVIDAGWLSFYAEAGDLIGFTLDKDGEIDSLYFTDRTDGTLVGDYRSTKVNPKSFYWETNYGDKFAVINAEKQRIAIDKDGNPATEDYDVYYVDDTTVIYVLSSKTSDNQQYKIDSGKVMAAEDFLTKYDGRINTALS